MLYSIFFLLSLPYIQSTYVISLYGDVYKDSEFFTRTFPWIIDNIGGEIMVDYHMVGSGRYTVPQMCALQEMRLNTFLQAQYLKCEAEGKPSEFCLCETGISPQKFKQCVSSQGSLASTAAAKFTQVGIDNTPLIELGPKITVFGVQDVWYLKKICTIFGDNLPRGCLKPFACNQTEVYNTKKALAQFDVNCCWFDANYCEFNPEPYLESTTYLETSTTTTPEPYYHSTPMMDRMEAPRHKKIRTV